MRFERTISEFNIAFLIDVCSYGVRGLIVNRSLLLLWTTLTVEMSVVSFVAAVMSEIAVIMNDDSGKRIEYRLRVKV